jgi:diguanylate cyclase
MKNAKPTPSIALRIATLMDRERIESLPRNYELIFDAYSGSNPDLTREFMAIEGTKTQKALDEIGRRYLPHQHEESVLAKANGTMQSQMFEFLQLIQNEASSLAEFEKAIDEASRAVSSDKEIDRAAIAQSIDRLSKATVQQARNNKTLSNAAAAQNAAISELKKEMDALEARKWTDPVTGLGNRRSFNKTMVGVFANPDRPTPCGLAFAELDDFQNYAASGQSPYSNRTLQDIAAVFKASNPARQFIANLDKGRFAIVLNTENPDRITGFIAGIRSALEAKRLLVTKKNAANEKITLSFGIAMASPSASAGELIGNAEKALGEAIEAGGDKLRFHALAEAPDAARNYQIYAAR